MVRYEIAVALKGVLLFQTTIAEPRAARAVLELLTIKFPVTEGYRIRAERWQRFPVPPYEPMFPEWEI